jgi:hypothetical protein
MTQEAAAEWLTDATMTLVTDSTISRLEGRDTLPIGPKTRPMRRNAYLLCLRYWLDPAELDLGDEDGPGELSIARIKRAVAAKKPVSECYPGLRAA